jgi:WD40 repeat protein
LLQRIGRGAYGEVWLARNALGTLRAVKIVYRSRFKEDRPYERELEGILKYEPVSRTHEGLVQVLHVGRSDEVGCFYYVMELADGEEMQNEKLKGKSERAVIPSAASGQQPISNFEFYILNYQPKTLRSDLAFRQRLPPVEAAQLAVHLARALAHLHAQDLVHRDIKPGNVIFVAGRPKLADIGLVTDVGHSKSFVGTEGFIPPEGPGTPQADLYGLGKLLYEAATGRDRMEFPQLPPGVTRLPDGEALLELNEVITRACAPNAKQRYASATELQADLNLFLAGRSLRRARRLERHLTQLKHFAAVACAVLVLAGVIVGMAKREERLAVERARTEKRLRERAETAEHDSRQQLYTALLEQGRATVRSGELGHRIRALDALCRAANISNAVELRREVFAALALPDLRFERELPTGSDATLVQLDPAFERIALGRGRASVEIRSVSDNRLLMTLAASTNLPAHSGRWSPDGSFLAIKRDYDSSGRRADLEVWELASARRVLLLRDVPWAAVAFHPRLPLMMAALRNGVVASWNLPNGEENTRFRFPSARSHLAYSPDGKRFVIAYDLNGRGVISLHDSSDGKPLWSQVFPHGVWAPDWHPGGRWIAMGGNDGSVNLIDSQSAEYRVLGRHKAETVMVVFSPNGKYLVSGGWDRELIFWDLQAMQRVLIVGLDSYSLQFRADGRQCALATRALTSSVHVRLHSFEAPTGLRELAEDLGARLRHASFSPDGRWLGVSGDERMGVWDLNVSGPAAVASEGAFARLSFNPNAEELFASRDDDCFRWRLTPGTNLESGPQLERLDLAKPRGFTSLCLISNVVAMTSAQGTRLMSPDDFDTADGPWKPTSSGLNGVSPDERWLGIYRAFARSYYVYRLPDLERVAKLTHPSAIGEVRFSPLGDEVTIASRGGVEFWSTTDWKRTRVLTNFMRILYAPDARTWWLTQDLRTAGLYDAHTLELLLPLPAGVLPLALSPDGRHLAVSVDARRLQVWDVVEVRERLRKLGMDWANR